ncbi:MULTISPECIES: DUF4239 domain-containing protein [unclassified Streptomyces]|uniref:bestrophin-like domain n=1 Tax=unclassified Streptomyces TaxID=2593676 RepID=UPI000F44AA77|nr:DUF4239 domain-containing protein [Streptomyces sp. I6]RNL71417.1 DUF4239 domain-containing protein [Streptomyces sp. I6]
MTHTLLQALPLWALRLLVLVVVVAVALGMLAVVRWVTPGPASRSAEGLRPTNQVVAGLLGVVGIVYALLSGFTIFNQWEVYVSLRNDVRLEVSALDALASGSHVLGPDDQARVVAAVEDYARAVVAEWPALSRGDESQATGNSYDALLNTIESVRGETDQEDAFLDTAMGLLAQVAERHSLYIQLAEQGHLEDPVWFALLVSGAMTLLFCCLFLSDRPRLHLMMIVGVALVVAVSLVLIIQLDNPLSSGLELGPASHEQLISDLGES